GRNDVASLLEQAQSRVETLGIDISKLTSDECQTVPLSIGQRRTLVAKRSKPLQLYDTRMGYLLLFVQLHHCFREIVHSGTSSMSPTTIMQAKTSAIISAVGMGMWCMLASKVRDKNFLGTSDGEFSADFAFISAGIRFNAVCVCAARETKTRIVQRHLSAVASVDDALEGY